MRPIVTTLLAIDMGGKVIGNSSVVRSSAGDQYPAMEWACAALLCAAPSAVKIEVWRHGQKVDEYWR